ncbi:hypothetical protein [Chryseobacterium rhizosphaerae]|uniref:T9SS C-terminal target domain-containing protein n=1 Tax=Chryseobacterium rhizosphaerae TaxID=395937 RepID=A0ABX9IIV1_9FLAO|nr:hypothetical protein [Chryseobacterium rhizosphaerae]REC74405.1 hypothetical protein DRF57_14190 [Chryseobacterium rhizosphaerae]GEN68235.1 hypothetical protein CRH01_28030 [Chryseobacterium rhizosphaerae]
MAKKTIAALKEYFRAGKRPTESQFSDLIDSYVHMDAFNPNAYLPLSGGKMSGVLSLGSSSATWISRDLSDISVNSNFARYFTKLTGSNGDIDSFGYYGAVTNTGSVTMNWGFIGGIAYNGKNAIRWTPDQRVAIGGSAAVIPTTGYALDVIGNAYIRGDVAFAGGLNTYQGSLQIQHLNVNKLRADSVNTILSASSNSGTSGIFLRPAGDTVATNQIIINANGTQYVDNYNLLFGSQAATGSSIFHTNVSGSNTSGYGIWMAHNLQFNGTDFIQPRGTLNSWAFTVNNHKGFSFNKANTSAANGSVVPLIELVKISGSGVISTLNNGSSDQWNTAYGWGNHAGKYVPINHATPANALLYQNDMLAVPVGTYVATVNSNSSNLPFAQVGGLISFGNTALSTRLLGARDNSDNLWFQSGDGKGAWRQLASRDWVITQLASASKAKMSSAEISSAPVRETSISIKKEYEIDSAFYQEINDETEFITVTGNQPSDMICNITEVYSQQDIKIINLSTSSLIKLQIKGSSAVVIEPMKYMKIYITGNVKVINLGQFAVEVLA